MIAQNRDSVLDGRNRAKPDCVPSGHPRCGIFRREGPCPRTMAETRTVLIGTGAFLMIIGFFVSTVVCGIGVLFIILGLVMWPRRDD